MSAWVPVFGCTGANAYFQSRQHRDWLRKLLILLVVFAFIPALNASFQLFNSMYYARWFYMLTLMLILATLRCFEEEEPVEWSRAVAWSGGITAAIALASSVWCFGGIGSGLWLFAQAACAILLFCSYGCAKGASLLGIGAWLSGALCVAVQIVDAIPGEVFSTSGLFPVFLFPLCTIVLGAVFSQLAVLGEPVDHVKHPVGRFYLPLRICLWIMLVITAIAPIIPWEDTYMARSAIILMQTQLYWMGVIFSGVVLGLSHMGRVTLVLQAIIAFVSIFGLRTAFYADGVHGVIDMSTLYRPF
jgi:hypothetical protein